MVRYINLHASLRRLPTSCRTLLPYQTLSIYFILFFLLVPYYESDIHSYIHTYIIGELAGQQHCLLQKIENIFTSVTKLGQFLIIMMISTDMDGNSKDKSEEIQPIQGFGLG